MQQLAIIVEDYLTSLRSSNSHGHAKEFLRNLCTIWARALTKVRQHCSKLIVSQNLGLSRVYCLCCQICCETVMCTVTCSDLNSSTKLGFYARYLQKQSNFKWSAVRGLRFFQGRN